MSSTEYEWNPVDGQCFTFTVSYSAEPFRPAVINADPDKCHPEEGGICDIEVGLYKVSTVWFGDEATETIWLRGGFDWPFSNEFSEKAEDAVLRECEEELREACECAEDDAHERALADRDDAREAAREQRRLEP